LSCSKLKYFSYFSARWASRHAGAHVMGIRLLRSLFVCCSSFGRLPHSSSRIGVKPWRFLHTPTAIISQLSCTVTVFCQASTGRREGNRFVSNWPSRLSAMRDVQTRVARGYGAKHLLLSCFTLQHSRSMLPCFLSFVLLCCSLQRPRVRFSLT
jgi:hypothetical protein